MSTPIKKIPLTHIEDINQENIIRIPSATYSELGVTPESTIEEKQIAIAAFLEGHVIESEDVTFFELKEDVEPEYNFDVTGNWDLKGVVDEPTFNSFLKSNGFLGEVFEDPLNIPQFSLVNNKLQATILDITNTPSLDLSETEITEVIAVPNEVTSLNLANNLIETFDIQLPENLLTLTLDDNLLTSFNPTTPLPSTLLNLFINGNLIEEFVLNLPPGISSVNMNGNQITSYSEEAANNMVVSTNSGGMYFFGNPTSPNGTNFKTILESKNWIINP